MSNEPEKPQFRVSQDSRADVLARLPLREYFVDRGSTAGCQRALRAALEDGKERDVQRVLQNHPRLLTQHLTANMGWVIPQKRLGSEFVTDFLVAEQLSPGFFWQAVELENPRVPMFTRSGDPSRYLVHAIRQILDWRVWLEANLSYATRSRQQSGLGLTEISPRVPGLILISRRQFTDDTNNARRRQMMTELRIDIRTYDSLLEDRFPQPLYVQYGDLAWGS